MKTIQRNLFFIALGTLLPALSFSAPMFITDRVTVDILAEPSTTAAVLTHLSTGDRVNLLSSEGDYSQINTEDNTTGWILAQYISDEEPIQKVFSQLVAKHRTILNELKTAQIKIRKMRKLNKQVANLKNDSKELEINKTIIKQLQETLDNKNIELTRMKGRLSQLPQGQGQIRRVGLTGTPTISNRLQTLPLKVIFAILGVTLLLGIFTGYQWLDHKISKRHGGIRFY